MIFINYIEANTVIENILLSLDTESILLKYRRKVFWGEILCIAATVAFAV